MNTPVLVGRDIHKTFRRDTGETVQALDGVSLQADRGTLTALVGPDGAGKTTLIRLVCGLMTADRGELKVLDIDVAAHPQQVQSRVGYMPQKFGLYEDLTVQENLNLYAELHGVTGEDRKMRYPQLMEMTALGPFKDRLAGRLSGGMQQKLGLACALVRAPELLVLDEPTVGVDPLSRRELWEIILKLVHQQNLSVLLSTSYLDEAERCGHVVVLLNGKVLAQGPPSQLLDDPNVTDAVPEGGQVRLVRKDAKVTFPGMVPTPARFEDGFMVLLRRAVGDRLVGGSMKVDHPPAGHGGEVVVEVHDLVRMFGKFTAVNHVSFDVRRGEIFGLLGPNGAGKTTTFRMLCGLLTVTGGTLKVAGADLRRAGASARQRIGYVAQKFSLYGQLSVAENLGFFASAYGLRGDRKRQRINWALQQFELTSLARLPSGQLPGGFKQRLAMATALLHEPETLFLDEPTSGADPLARREFWRRITALAEQGVTVIVTTHFMEEAEYCDRVAIMDAGRVLAQGTPAEIRHRALPEPDRKATMEDAFIAIVEESRRSAPDDKARAGGAA